MLTHKLALALATLKDAFHFNPLFCPFFLIQQLIGVRHVCRGRVSLRFTASNLPSLNCLY